MISVGLILMNQQTATKFSTANSVKQRRTIHGKSTLAYRNFNDNVQEDCLHIKLFCPKIGHAGKLDNKKTFIIITVTLDRLGCMPWHSHSTCTGHCATHHFSV